MIEFLKICAEAYRYSNLCIYYKWLCLLYLATREDFDKIGIMAEVPIFLRIGC
jgi:hypothetical protein